MPNWIEKYVSEVLKRNHIEEAWIADVAIRQRNNGQPKEVRMLLDPGPSASAKTLVIPIPKG